MLEYLNIILLKILCYIDVSCWAIKSLVRKLNQGLESFQKDEKSSQPTIARDLQTSRTLESQENKGNRVSYGAAVYFHNEHVV